MAFYLRFNMVLQKITTGIDQVLRVRNAFSTSRLQNKLPSLKKGFCAVMKMRIK